MKKNDSPIIIKEKVQGSLDFLKSMTEENLSQLNTKELATLDKLLEDIKNLGASLKSKSIKKAS